MGSKKQHQFTRELEGDSTPRELAGEALDHFRRARRMVHQIPSTRSKKPTHNRD